MILLFFLFCYYAVLVLWYYSLNYCFSHFLGVPNSWMAYFKSEHKKDNIWGYPYIWKTSKSIHCKTIHVVFINVSKSRMILSKLQMILGVCAICWGRGSAEGTASDALNPRSPPVKRLLQQWSMGIRGISHNLKGAFEQTNSR